MTDQSLWNRAGIAEFWRRWEGQVVDGLLPLREYVGGAADHAVFLTEYHLASSRRTAVKLVLASGRNAAMLLERWRTAEAVPLPQLIRLFGCGSGALHGVEFVYVVMEYADEELASVLATRCLTAAEARDLLEPVLDALVRLHAEGFVHGHLSPANILAVDDRLKLSSDSLCRWAGERTRLRDCDEWDAPEMVRGEVSPAADIWSLGALVAAALTKRSASAGALPEPFREIVSHCLPENPGHRWTASQIQAYLSAPVPAARAGKRPRSFRWIAAPVAALLVVVLIVIWSGRGIHRAASPIAASALPQSPAPLPPARPDRVHSARTAGARVQRVSPDIPQKARETIRGTVRINVKVEVDESGNVTDASIVPPEGSRYLANLTLDAARRWRFPPGRSQEWLLRFQIRRTDTTILPERLK